MKKRNKTMYFLFMITLFSCTYPGINRDSDTPRKQKIEDVSPGITKSVIAPEFAGYVGDGYDMLKLNTSPIESLKGQCLTDLEVRRVIGEARTNTNNFSTENYYGLELKLNFHQDVSAKISLFDKASAGGSFNLDIVNNLNFSSRTVAIVGIVEYSDSFVFINQGIMTPEARTLYETNRYLFEQQYGTGYCEKVELGERMIVVFTYSFKDFKNYTKLDFKAAAEANFLEIFSGKANTNTTIENTVFAQNTEVHSYCYSTGSFIPGYVGTREDFVKQYNAWIDYTNEKISSGKGTLSIINRIYQPYSKILALQESASLDLYAEMLYEWKKTAAQIRIVMNDTNDSGLIQNCRDAMILVQNEIEKCQQKASDARFPDVDEFPEIQKLWILKTSTPLYKLHAVKKVPVIGFCAISTSVAATITQSDQHVFDHYICVPEEKLTDKINQLREDNPDIAFEYQGIMGYIPQLDLTDSHPIYSLTAPDKISLFLTTDKEERNQKLYNENYTIPEEGAILGYLFHDQVYDFTPFHQVQVNTKNRYIMNVIINKNSYKFITIPFLSPHFFINSLYTFDQTEKDYWNEIHILNDVKNISGTAKVNFSWINLKLPYTGTMSKTSNLVPVINRTLGYLPAVN